MTARFQTRYFSNQASILVVALLNATIAATAADSGLTAHWQFSPDRQQGQKVKPVVGRLNAVKQGDVLFADNPAPARAIFDGQGGRLILSKQIDPASMPRAPFSAEAWVTIDRPSSWGNIIGALQDNGSDEHGWSLGYINSHFSFAIASPKTERLTYLKSQTAFEPNRWFHVIGTYDGTIQRIYVDGKLENQSTVQQGPIAYPTSASFEIGAYHDADEDYPMTGAIHEIKLYSHALTEDEVVSNYEAKKDEFPAPAPPPVLMEIAYGPFADWIDRTTIRLSWEVDEPMPTQLEFSSPIGEIRRWSDPQPKIKHAIVLDKITPDVEYNYRIEAPPIGEKRMFSERYQFDSSFYYAPVSIPDKPYPFAQDNQKTIYENVAERILESSRLVHGYCLVLGAEEGRLAYEIARRTQMKVVVVESDLDKANHARRALDKAGLYGVRATVHQGSLNELPYGSYFANLIVSESTVETGRLPAIEFNDLFRMLRPAGGQLHLGQPQDNNAHRLAQSELRDWIGRVDSATVDWDESDGTWLKIVRGRLKGAGDWSHQYGGTENSSCSNDELVQGELGVLWWGEPGPRPMPDRGPRNPAPLSVNGRMFVQGNRILFGIDAYNGSILWNLSAPEMRRANLPRDCSNMAAAPDALYLAHGRYCLAIEPQFGTRDQRFAVPGGSREYPLDWGYLAVVEHLLVGSAVKLGGRYLGDNGEWFEDYNPNEVSRVTSTHLFGLDRKSGAENWRYEEGVIINSTITIADGMIFFLESRAPEALAATSGRLAPEVLTDVHLVCLDLNSGQPQWERAHDFSKCEFMVYLSHSNETLVVTGADQDKNYHTFAFNTRTSNAAENSDGQPLTIAGTLLWEESHIAGKDHHSGHLQHPVIIDDVFYSDQRALSLREGKILRTDLPERRGCGTMSASQNSVFFRHYYHGQWDLKTNKRVQFEGIRSGCWLAMIPAGGLLLAPEASAGCSCANAIQTSVAYIPKLSDPRSFK